MVTVVTHPSHQILCASSTALSVDYLVNHVLFSAVLSDNSTWSSKFAIGKKCQVVGHKGFEKARVETWEGLWIVGEM